MAGDRFQCHDLLRLRTRAWIDKMSVPEFPLEPPLNPKTYTLNPRAQNSPGVNGKSYTTTMTVMDATSAEDDGAATYIYADFRV